MKRIKLLCALSTMTSLTLPILTTISCGKSNLNPKNVLTIGRWGNDAEVASQQEAINAFQDKYNVEVKLITLDYGKRTEQISKWASSGNLPDIIEIDGADYSSYATSQLIKPLNKSEIEATTLSNLIPQSLGTMYGKVTDEKWSYVSIPTKDETKDLNGEKINLIDQSKIESNNLWGIPKEFNTLGVYVNNAAFKDQKAAKALWDQEVNKNNSTLFNVLTNAELGLKNDADLAGILQAKTSSHHIGAMSFTNDPNRFTQLFSDSDYEKYKAYTKSDIIANQESLKTSLKKWWNPLAQNYLSLNQSRGSVTAQGHGYGWNGEAFDKKAVGAVIEGAWYTPSTEAFANDQWSIWEAPNAGLFPQGWALTAGSNDDDLAYKFLSYIASAEGAEKETSKTGANPVNIDAFNSQISKAKDASDQTFSAEIKKKIIAHGEAFSKEAKPLLFTSEYPLFQKAWQDNFNKIYQDQTKVNQDVFNQTIDKIMTQWIRDLKDAA